MERFEKQLALAAKALRECGFRYGMYVFITGCDEQAMVLGALAKHSGAAAVVLGAHTDSEAAAVEKLGFAAYLYGKEDSVAFAKQVTGGRMYDLAFETLGAAEGYAALMDSVKRGAAVGVLKKLDTPYTFLVKTAVRSQIRFVGLREGDAQSTQTAKTLLAQKKLDDVLSRIPA